MEKKARIKSKTLWFNAIVAGIGALETAAPGTIPPGPTLVAISVVGAVLRAMTVAPVR
jgi:hypothetical protein